MAPSAIARRRGAWEREHLRWLALRQREQALSALLRRHQARQTLVEARREQKLLTGLLYVEPQQMPFEDELKLVEAPLAALPLERVRPPKSVLDEIMSQYMTGKGLTAPAGGG